MTIRKRVLVINTANTGLTGITSVIQLLSFYTKEIYDFSFVLNGKVDKAKKDYFQECLGKVYIPPVSRSKSPIRYLLWLKALIKHNKFDVVHVHGNSGTIFFDIHAAYLANTKIRIAHCHSTSCKHKVVHHLLKRLLNKETTSCIACSEAAGRWLFYKEFTIVKNAIDIEKYKYSKIVRNDYRKMFHFEQKYVIGHIGYMDVEKNQTFLIKCFYEVSKINNDAVLVLIGDGRLKYDLEQQVSKMGLKEKVYFLGNRQDVSSLYNMMDVFTLPSLFEGLPVTLIEAQTNGLQCIASSHISRESDITGLIHFLPVDGEDDIDKWVECLTSNGINRRQSYAYELVKKSDYNIQNNIINILKIYEE